VAGMLRGVARCERAVRPPPGGVVQGAKLITFTDNIQLCLVKWPDDGQPAETCGRNKIEYMNIVMSDGNQLNILLSFSKVNPLNAELNLICYLLALSVHHFLHVST